MTSTPIKARMVYMQGRDAKAMNWSRHFTCETRFFQTLRHMIAMVRNTRAGDVLIYRYQNSPKRFSSALAILLVMTIQLAKAYLSGMHVVWICHNVDQETQPYHKWIERARRTLLARQAHTVFVLDPTFPPHCVRPDAEPITFGRKEGGSTSLENIEAIERLRSRVDVMILIAGQDGGKYKAFARIPEIFQRFAGAGSVAGFITAGMCSARHFSYEIEQNLLRIEEPNMREIDIAGMVDYIYRENADVSVPYSIYAAATAGIPVLTRSGSLLEEIVERENIGTSLERAESMDRLSYDFEGFLARHCWSSLRDALHRRGVLV